MAQAQKLAQVRRFDLPEQRHVRAILAARQQSAERDHQQLKQVVAGIVPAWVHNLGKAGDELFHRAASTLDRTARLQPCPVHRNTRPQAPTSAPASYAIALSSSHFVLHRLADLRILAEPCTNHCPPGYLVQPAPPPRNGPADRPCSSAR